MCQERTDKLDWGFKIISQNFKCTDWGFSLLSLCFFPRHSVLLLNGSRRMAFHLAHAAKLLLVLKCGFQHTWLVEETTQTVVVASVIVHASVQKDKSSRECFCRIDLPKANLPGHLPTEVLALGSA